MKELFDELEILYDKKYKGPQNQDLDNMIEVIENEIGPASLFDFHIVLCQDYLQEDSNRAQKHFDLAVQTYKKYEKANSREETILGIVLDKIFIQEDINLGKIRFEAAQNAHKYLN